MQLLLPSQTKLTCGRSPAQYGHSMIASRCLPLLPRGLSLKRRHFRSWSVEPELNEQPVELTSEMEPTAEKPVDVSEDEASEKLTEYKSEDELKKERADELRKAEKFMIIGEGNATCSSCGYNYEVAKGDPDFPVPRGTRFQDTPEDYRCPLCGAPKEKFRSTAKTIAGFAVNQGYGFGTNAMTGGQKQLLIYGSLLFFFVLFISGYLLD